MSPFRTSVNDSSNQNTTVNPKEQTKLHQFFQIPTNLARQSDDSVTLQSRPKQVKDASEHLRIDDVWRSSQLDQHFGDDLQCKENTRLFRVYFQNVNSLKSNRWEKWLHACNSLKKKDVDLFGMAEIGINPRFPQATEEISQIARRTWTHAVTTITNTAHDQHGLAQRGGTSLTTTSHWVS